MADQMKDALDGLTRAVQVNGDRTQAAITAFQGIAQQIHAAADNEDTNAVHALADRINAQSQTLADAISANTPGGGTGGTPAPAFESLTLTGTQEPAPNPAHPGSIPPPPPAPTVGGMGGSGTGQSTPAASPPPEGAPSDSVSSDTPQPMAQPDQPADQPPVVTTPSEAPRGTDMSGTGETPKASF